MVIPFPSGNWVGIGKFPPFDLLTLCYVIILEKTQMKNLDEYRGLDRGNVHSYYYYMQEKLFSKVNIRQDRTFMPDVMRDRQEERS